MIVDGAVWLRRLLQATIVWWGAIRAAGRILRGDLDTVVFGAGLAVLCLSVAQWSRPLAGVIVGGVLMAVAAWPFLRMRNDE